MGILVLIQESHSDFPGATNIAKLKGQNNELRPADFEVGQVQSRCRWHRQYESRTGTPPSVEAGAFYQGEDSFAQDHSVELEVRRRIISVPHYAPASAGLRKEQSLTHQSGNASQARVPDAISR